MPRRKIYFANDEIYHVFNRSVARQTIFDKNSEYQRFIKLIDFYRFRDNSIKLSRLLSLDNQLREKYLDTLYTSPQKVEILAFAIMPNHYHILIKQKSDMGISNFIRLVQNAYAKYLNLKLNRSGALFQSPFKAVRIENQEQLVHTSRYIHLNPLTSFILKDMQELSSYSYTSFSDYLTDSPRKFVNEEPILNFFKSKEKFYMFNEDNVGYQRDLNIVKHLGFD